jgi:hypothetical protein
VSAIRRLADHRPELVEQQPENGLTLALVPTQTLGVVMEDGAGGAALEAAPRSVIEFVGGDFGRQGQIHRHARRGWLPWSQSGFELADALFLQA